MNTEEGFNSILVRLKVLALDNDATEIFSFNSILVRLKVSQAFIETADLNEFQFHTGSIKSRLIWQKKAG